MHSLDTVKTRQQGDTHIPPRYSSMSSSYATIFRQEGFRRGLYSGVTPAFLGSFPGTIIFFGTYEYSKRHLIDKGVPHSLAYLAGGLWISAEFWLVAYRCFRIYRRLRRFLCLCSLRSPEDPSSTPRPLQQSFLPIGLQLPLNIRCGSYHYPPRGHLCAVLRLQGDDIPGPPFLGSAIHVLRTGAKVGKTMGRQQGHRAWPRNPHWRDSGWYGRRYYMSLGCGEDEDTNAN